MRPARPALRPVRLLLLTLLYALLNVALAAAPDIFVAYPDPNYRVAHDRIILEGSVTPGATLSIDGKAVNVGPDGLFMEWWPLKVGVNDLKFIARQGAQTGTLTWRVTRTPPRVYPAVPTAIDRQSVTPRAALEFWDAPGDTPVERSIEVSFQGSPGGKATYRLGGGAAQTMQEIEPGRYTDTYVLPPSARLQNVAFSVTLTGRNGKSVTAVAPGRISSTRLGTRLGTQKEGSVQGQGLNEATVVATDLQGEPLLYPRNGMTFTLVGRQGEDVRARLAPGVSALISAGQLTIGPGSVKVASGGPLTLPGNLASASVGSSGTAGATQAAAPTTEITPLPAPPSDPNPAPGSTDPGEITPLPPTPTAPATPEPAAPPKAAPPVAMPAAGADLNILIPLGGARLPFTAEQADGGQRLTVTLYGKLSAPLSAPTSTDARLTRVDIRPLALNVTQLHFHLRDAQAWGFNVNYQGPDLLVSFRRPPTLNPARPLEGRVITLDPGHGGTQKGGAGSLRVPEKNIVLPIALRAAELLRAQGASVNLTRTTDQTLGLYERGLQAERTRADLLVSIHANALPDGRDPRGIRGPEVYFTHPQAQNVAQAILNRLRLNLPELGPGDGLKPDAFLALTRPTTQISLLVETAYLTDPGNLRALMSADGRERFAQAIAQGIADFYAAQVKP